MICPECSNVVAIKRNRCDRCGEDLITYKKMYMLSNRYYNGGLEKAKVRDLSGAVLLLNNSLEINKRNTNARNLLGLVYYEMGETVAALSEWVISKHFQANDNDADEYMEALQANPTRLDTLNQTIKKYNAALLSANQGSDDLAIIQLKKVTSLNPHFVKALQLLALLYMKNNEQDKAVKCLIKASKIDVSNTTTLRYLRELGEMASPVREENKVAGRETVKKSSEQSLFPQTTYKEDKPNVWAWVNLIIGLAIGICTLFILVVPTIKGNYENDIKNLQVEHDSELSKQTQTITSLEKEKQSLEEQLGKLQEQVDGFEVVTYDDTIYDTLFKVSNLYITELEKGKNNIDVVKVAEELSKVKVETLEKADAITLYETMKEATFVDASKKIYDEGHKLYQSRKYEEALEKLNLAYELDPDNVSAIYFIGRSYHQLSDFEKARTYYTILIENYPDTGRAGEAENRLAELN